MCGAGKFGRAGGKIDGRQIGISASHVRRNNSNEPSFTLIELSTLFLMIHLRKIKKIRQNGDGTSYS